MVPSLPLSLLLWSCFAAATGAASSTVVQQHHPRRLQTNAPTPAPVINGTDDNVDDTLSSEFDANVCDQLESLATTDYDCACNYTALQADCAHDRDADGTIDVQLSYNDALALQDVRVCIQHANDVYEDLCLDLIMMSVDNNANNSTSDGPRIDRCVLGLQRVEERGNITNHTYLTICDECGVCNDGQGIQYDCDGELGTSYGPSNCVDLQVGPVPILDSATLVLQNVQISAALAEEPPDGNNDNGAASSSSSLSMVFPLMGSALWTMLLMTLWPSPA